MRSNLDPRQIIRCNFSPHRSDHERHLSWPSVLLYLVAPVGIGVYAEHALGVLEGEHLPMVAAVYSVLTAVLMGLLPIVYSVASQVERGREYSSGERLLAHRELIRLDTLQDLYATVGLRDVPVGERTLLLRHPGCHRSRRQPSHGPSEDLLWCGLLRGSFDRAFGSQCRCWDVRRDGGSRFGMQRGHPGQNALG